MVFCYCGPRKWAHLEGPGWWAGDAAHRCTWLWQGSQPTCTVTVWPDSLGKIFMFQKQMRNSKPTCFHHLPGHEELLPHPTGTWVWAMDKAPLVWAGSAISLGWKHIWALPRLFSELRLARWERCWAWQRDHGPVRGRGRSRQTPGEQVRGLVLLCSWRP